MAPRSHLGGLALVALMLGAAPACKGDADNKTTDPPAAGSASLDKRCERLAKLCGDKAKHVAKITEECMQVEKAEGDCKTKLLAAWDCYEKEVCMTMPDKVWSIDDLGVLAERHKKCAPERAAAVACSKK